MIFSDSSLPILDLRDKLAFETQHLIKSANITRQSLANRLNELPARPAVLNLIVTQYIDSRKTTLFLEEKGYQINQVVDENQLLAFLADNVSYQQRGQQITNLWKPSSLVQQFVEKISTNKHNLTVIDIGCGGGRDAVYLSQQGWKVTAIEHKEQVISRAKSLAKSYQQSINWLTCDVSTPGCLPKDKYDLVIIIRWLFSALLSEKDS